MSQSLLNPAPQTSALTTVESSRAIQEVQAAMVIAKKFPRDERGSLDRILNACTRPGLANAAVYQYARGGTDITGPSIRLAEAIAQNWGNLQWGIRELEQANGESTVEAFAWDVENNTRQTKTFQVPHVRHTKQGVKKLTDPRDIYELVANNGARRLRACILGIVPGDVVEEALHQCETTMAADADTSEEAQTKIIAAFAKYSVTKEQIEKRIQRRMDSITAAQVVALRKIMASLKDGMSKPEEWFDGFAPSPVPAPTGGLATMLAAPSQPAKQVFDKPSDEEAMLRLTEIGATGEDYVAALRHCGLSTAKEWKNVSVGEHATALIRWEEVEQFIMEARV